MIFLQQPSSSSSSSSSPKRKWHMKVVRWSHILILDFRPVAKRKKKKGWQTRKSSNCMGWSTSTRLTGVLWVVHRHSFGLGAGIHVVKRLGINKVMGVKTDVNVGMALINRVKCDNVIDLFFWSLFRVKWSVKWSEVKWSEVASRPNLYVIMWWPCPPIPTRHVNVNVHVHVNVN